MQTFKRRLSCRQIHKVHVVKSQAHSQIAAVNVYPYPVKPQTILFAANKTCHQHRNAEDVEARASELTLLPTGCMRRRCEQDEHLKCALQPTLPCVLASRITLARCYRCHRCRLCFCRLWLCCFSAMLCYAYTRVCHATVGFDFCDFCLVTGAGRACSARRDGI